LRIATEQLCRELFEAVRDGALPSAMSTGLQNWCVRVRRARPGESAAGG